MKTPPLTALTLLFILFGYALYAQTFKASPKGFINSDTKEKFITINYPNKSCHEIYKTALTRLEVLFYNPQEVFTLKDDKQITINTIADTPVRQNSFHTYENEFRLNLYVSDGKLKVIAPKITLTDNYNGEKYFMYFSPQESVFCTNKFGMFKKNGEAKYTKTIEDVEAFANQYITILKNIFKNTTES